jgi:diadenosine tetraphosphate (Ap4A) HIT family hydrolase
MTESEVALDAGVLTARARAAYGPDGRLPVPESAGWDIFPYAGDLQVKHLADPVLPEPPRQGEKAADCDCRQRDDGDYLWTDERWRIGTTGAPQAVPAYLLMPREHLDLGDLSDALAAELGILIVRLDRVLSAISGAGRVHVNKWGDGGAHLHVWFIVRPAGMLQLRGSCLPGWMDVLPPLPADEAATLDRYVARTLARSGGTAHV